MKKTLIKIDRLILNSLTSLVKRYIKKNDFKKHKVDFQIELKKYKTASLMILAALVPAIGYILEGHFFSGGFHLAIWSISVGMGFMSIQKSIREEKPRHDLLFGLRKNPQVYQMEKEVLEVVFIQLRRNRIKFMVADLSISWFFAVALGLMYFVSPIPYLTLAVYFAISPFFNLADYYMLFVFDFDEPEEKKKVAKESVSEIFLRAWQNLIGGLNPLPQT